MRRAGGELGGDSWVVLVDAAEQPLLVALAAGESDARNGAADRLRARCADLGGAPYGLVASPSAIRIHNGTPGPPIAEIPVGELLRRYHHEPAWQLSPSYLLVLVEAWLSDLVYAWGDVPAPAAADLDACGLLPALRRPVAWVVPDENGSLRP